jgi:hypothetical protein
MALMKSSHMGRRKNLATNSIHRRSEDLLQFWANLANVSAKELCGDIVSLTKSFPEVFGELLALGEPPDSSEAGDRLKRFIRSVRGLRDHLRAAWEAPDLREREWYIFEVRRLYAHHTKSESAQVIEATLELDFAPDPLEPEGSQSQFSFPGMYKWEAAYRRRRNFWGYLVNPPPELTAFERVMFHFQRIAHRAHKCENPECKEPYFFRKKKGQKYCMPECALPAQRNSKSEWWAKHREEQNRKRKRKRRAERAEQQKAKRTGSTRSIGGPRKKSESKEKKELK